ncbi:MAG: hypothetical protein AAB091_03935 [Elusimicrobiota bacterium]
MIVKLNEFPEVLDTQTCVFKDGVKGFSFDRDAGMDRDHRPAAIAFSAIDGMTGSSLPGLNKTGISLAI